MITVQNDWVTYETVPVRTVAVRGGAACAQRTRVVSERPTTAARAVAPRPVAAPQPVVPVPSATVARSRRSSATPAGRTVEPRLRLTRRGRFVLIVLPAVLGATAALVAVTAPLAEAQPTTSGRTIVVVGTGDTLWSIAERVAPTADPRDVVADLELANHLSSATIQEGQRLVLPAVDGR